MSSPFTLLGIVCILRKTHAQLVRLQPLSRGSVQPVALGVNEPMSRPEPTPSFGRPLRSDTKKGSAEA